MSTLKSITKRHRYISLWKMVNSRNLTKKCKYYFSLLKLGNADVVKVLVENGADVNAADYLDRTPLNIALKNGK